MEINLALIKIRISRFNRFQTKTNRGTRAFYTHGQIRVFPGTTTSWIVSCWWKFSLPLFGDADGYWDRLAAPDPKYLKLTLVCLRKCNAPMQESEVIPVPRRLPMISAVKFIPERSSPGRKGAQPTYPSLSFSSVKFCGKVFAIYVYYLNEKVLFSDFHRNFNFIIVKKLKSTPQAYILFCKR